MPQVTLDQAMRIALRHQQAGRLREAEQVCREVLAQSPRHAPAMHQLGLIAHAAGRNQIAIDLIGRAIALEPNLAEAHYNLGVALQDVGHTDEASAAYRRAVALRPDLAEAHTNLGNVLKVKGQIDQAIAAYRRAIAVRPGYAEAFSNLGSALQANGQLDQAMAAYRQAIALRPDLPEAHGNLGDLLKDQGQIDEAIAAFRRAVALQPANPHPCNNLGNALKDKGLLDEAIAAFRRAIALRPNLPEAHVNLGSALKDKGQFDEAIIACRQAIDLRPDFPEACCNLGNVLQAQEQLDQAIAAYRQAISLRPGYAEAYNNLGIALREQRQLDAAIAAFRQAIVLRPGYAEAHGNLGNALKDTLQLDEAIAACRQAIALRPDYAEAYGNLGIALQNKRQIDEAVAAYRQAIALRPDFADAYSDLAISLKDQGQIDEAIAACRRAIALRPNFTQAHGNLVYMLHFHAGCDAREILREHRRWDELHARPLRMSIEPHQNDRNTDRRLKIGYVSPDFRDHVVGLFILPVLANHDKSQFEVFAYSQTLAPDEMTQRLRSHVDGWRDIVGLSDARVAELVRQDQIDILVDLTMHMADNRLLVFARKPAPVQVTYLGYCSTTGLATIDYRLSDPYLDPIDDGAPTDTEFLYSEGTIRLPETYWCYPGRTRSAVGALPVVEHGCITFGCLNNFCKASEATLTAWAKLLRAVPTSQFLLHAREGSHRQRVWELIQREGVDPERLRFAGYMPSEKYLDLYRQIDIALDPFPYGGGTTTCDALWMGVPVVSLAGKTAVGRGGLSILSNIGLPKLVARSEEQYVRIASELAGDLPRLRDLRSTLRQRMEQSPLMDAPRFARNIEAAYRNMWRSSLLETGDQRLETTTRGRSGDYSSFQSLVSSL